VPTSQYYQGFPEFKARRAALAGRALGLLDACASLSRRAVLERRRRADAAAAAGGGGAAGAAGAAGAGGGAGAADGQEAAAADRGEDEEERDERAVALAGRLVDDILERADAALDAAADARAEATALPAFVARAGSAPARGVRGGGGGAPGGGPPRGLQRYAPSLPRPQDAFPEPVDNSNAPFVPWPARRRGAAASSAPAPPASLAAGHTHPYALELDALTYEPWQLEAPEPVEAAPLDTAPPAVWVDTLAALGEMVAALRGAKHIAIDLEHHSYR
jgi:hypothetical protein